jgi:hypothetical protein
MATYTRRAAVAVETRDARRAAGATNTARATVTAGRAVFAVTARQEGRKPNVAIAASATGTRRTAVPGTAAHTAFATGTAVATRNASRC